ncbi:MAG: O-antigen polysaccharide polymerase Wzy [Pirellulales bacterium]|nr:O-antigen polysaccharide polymerase Wzy [Pirellulales bacterium]
MQTSSLPYRRSGLRLHVDRAIARQGLLAFQFLVLVFAFTTSFGCPKFIDNGHLWVSVWLSVAILLSQLIYRATGPKPINWLSIDLFVLFTIWLVHFYHVISWLLDFVPAGQELWLKNQNSAEAVCYAHRISLAGLAAFALGFNCLREKYATPLKPEAINFGALRSWYRIGVLMLSGGIAAGVILIALLGSEFFDNAYSGLGTAVFANYGQAILSALARSLMVAGAAIVAISGYRLKSGVFPGLVGSLLLFVYVAALLIAGDRDGAYTPVMIIAVAYTELVRPMKFRWLVIMLVLASAALGVAFIARNSPRRDPISMLDTVIKEVDQLRWDHGLVEVGGSSMTLYAATKYVPEYHDYYYGKMQLTRVGGIVPFASNIIGTLLEGYIDPRERDSASALTYYIYKQMPGYKGASGLGTTCVADIYMDFGIPGVAIAHFLVGMLCKLLMQKSRSSGSLVWMAAYMMAVPAVGYAARDSLVSVLLRYVWWQVALILVVGFVLGVSTRIASIGAASKRSARNLYLPSFRPASIS